MLVLLSSETVSQLEWKSYLSCRLSWKKEERGKRKREEEGRGRRKSKALQKAKSRRTLKSWRDQLTGRAGEELWKKEEKIVW